MAAPRLSVQGLSKTFGPVTVLDEVEFAVAPGEIHALVGQNGSGKSTLVKVLTGYHAPDKGATVAVDGRALKLPVHWAEAKEAGIAVVHQDLGLLDQLTVAENICVGDYVRSKYTRKIAVAEQNRVAAAALDRAGAAIRPTTVVAALTAAQRAEVAIARALRTGTPGKGVIIFDESTRPLGGEDRERVHGIIRRIAGRGTSVIIISHDLEEVLGLSDRVTVLRDGKVAGPGLVTGELTEKAIAQLMLGKTVGAVTRDTGRGRARDKDKPAGIVASVRDLAGVTLAGLSLELRAGEVVGLTGVPGSGFEEVPYLIGCARQAARGHLTLGGTQDIDLAKASVATAIRAGIALVPERRDRDGLALELSVKDNIGLPMLRKEGKPWFFSRSAQLDHARTAIRELGIRPAVPTRLIKELSGGNQQKVLFAKWLSTGPRLLVLHEPTQAVDVGARYDLLRAIRKAAADGVAVLIVSIEASDLAAVCDRVIVYHGPDRRSELTTDDPDQILHATYGDVPAEESA
jgi:ribose transport system ATP-binding protein